MLIFSLKKQWYEKIKNGEKTIEYREVKEYWTKRLKSVTDKIFPLVFFGFPQEIGDYRDFSKLSMLCYFQLGYKPETRIEAFITKIEIIDGQNTDLKTSGDVYAIHFKLRKPEK